MALGFGCRVVDTMAETTGEWNTRPLKDPNHSLVSQRAQYRLIKEYGLNYYIGLHIMI